MMVGLMIGDAGTVMEGTVREGIIRPTGTRGVVAIGPKEIGKNKKVIFLPSAHFVLFSLG